jgi:ketopantoate reductase
MLQDVEAGRTTEVRYLNGYVSSVGRERHGIECPRNDDMCQLVEELKSSSRASILGI